MGEVTSLIQPDFHVIWGYRGGQILLDVDLIRFHSCFQASVCLILSPQFTFL